VTSTVSIDVKLDPCESPNGPSILKANESPTMVINHYLRTHTTDKVYPVSVTYEPSHCVAPDYGIVYGSKKDWTSDMGDFDKTGSIDLGENEVTVKPYTRSPLLGEGTYDIIATGNSFTRNEPIVDPTMQMKITLNMIDPCKDISATNKPELTENDVNLEFEYVLR